MTSRFPDLEIYLKRVPANDIVEWLNTIFNDVSVLTQPASKQPSVPAATECLIQQTMTCNISENVAKGGFTSVWFKSNDTPWATDHECAVAAFDHFQIETRCSTGGWEGEDDGGWLRITDKGSQTVNWHT
ncbi:MAG: hypothetical protein ACJAYE_000849 [Candidatus Azotimanducaceae bacterium]|jgi:hypothetical protein